MIEITSLPAFSDNYIWTLVNTETKQCVCVDPGDATPVISFVQQAGLELTDILITHWHSDHTGGVEELQKHFECSVYAPAHSTKIHFDYLPVSEGMPITLGSIDSTFTVGEIPGHTLDHIFYYCRPWLFSGDTLFNGGCGYLFEGTYKQLFTSLNRLAALPEGTELYCTHEYTLNNLRFALELEPDNQELSNYFDFCSKQREHNLPTLPCTIKTQLAINPFLRCDQPAVIQASKQSSEDPVAVFKAIREWKDNF
jgi:hydroxyacylglutathione hydrolase